ncbi:hypothetical protein [Shewanella sp. MBTL60-007]|uniref:hypothetical protein n=1 Tax=Shewanella sp. MBTL60-007 TaxID=2815911 RepID=UPI001BBA4160|nr:hypothetical protein [Shewanella sp. MBTL60-007]GIU12462.1 hypothetical protein TUM3792_01040 [Shewanella sp. MBTL60-007]
MLLSYRNHIASSLVLLSSVLTLPAMADEVTQSDEYAIGVMVKSLDNAIKHPSEKSLTTITSYGTDSRYYVMIRGWLVQELQGANSQLDAYRQDDEIKIRLQRKVDFLKRAIRRIDLE